MKSRRKLISISIVLCIGVVLGGIAVHILNAPTHGHAVTPEAALVHPKKIAKPKSIPASSVQSNYFTIDLPAGYTIQNPRTIEPFLYQQTVLKPSIDGSFILNISLMTLPEGGAAENPTYHMMKLQPGRYEFTTKIVSNEPLELATDSQSADITVFWPHQSYLATIGVSSGISDAGSDQVKTALRVLQPLLDNWQWK